MKLKKRHRAPTPTKPAKRVGSSFVTYLPTLTEGNNLPLQPHAGFSLTDTADPNGWLLSAARNIDTDGTDVGYAIPDVMAGEQQIRRLIRLPHAEAMRHQEMRDWRAMLAVLLLWDSWEKDEYWPTLTLNDYLREQTDPAAEKPSAFRNALIRAISKARASQGICVFSLCRTTDLMMEVCPLAIVSPHSVIAPAANMQEKLLKRLLPNNVTWYNREKNRFEDPTPYLKDLDRLRLVMQLRVLQEMNSNQKLNSTLYAGDHNHLVGLLDQFIQDLNDFRDSWRSGIKNGDRQALDQLYHRIAGVKGLYRDGREPYISAISRHTYELTIGRLIQNPLLRSLMPPDPTPQADAMLVENLAARRVEDTRHIYYTYNQIPFAREDGLYILEPMNDPREDEAIAGITMEMIMMRDYSSLWNAEFGHTLATLASQTSMRVGAIRDVTRQLLQWSRERLAVPVNVNHTITLRYPLEGEPETLQALMREFLGMQTLDTIYAVFAERLVLAHCGDSQPPPFSQELATRQRVGGDEPAGQAQYGVIPMSERMVTWLTDPHRPANASAPVFLPESVFLTRTDRSGGDYEVRAGYAVRRTVETPSAIVENTVCFEKTFYYRSAEEPSENTRNDLIEETPLSALPSVLVWPNVMLPPTQWHAYWLYATQNTGLTLWALQDHGWHSLAAYERAGTDDARLTLCTAIFPRFVVLKRGGAMCGVLYNPARAEPLRADDAVVAAVDFGSTATAVMLQQGPHIFPALFERPLHGLLLHNGEALPPLLYDEFLPMDALDAASQGEQPNVYSSAVDVFAQDPAQWRTPLIDGHIYFYPGSEPYTRKDTRFLYYNIKWGHEQYRKQCVYLFLKQCMIQTSLIARLHGAPTVAWRFSLPGALPDALSQEYTLCVSRLAVEVADFTGLALAAENPVSFLSENEADGVFFLHEDMVDVRNGYINLDIGGTTSDVSLWLAAGETPVEEQSLELGSRSILFDSILVHPQRLSEDFATCTGDMQADLTRFLALLPGIHNQPRKRDMAMFLLDHWISRYADLARAMLAQRPEAEPAYLTSLVALSVSFLFFLCGELLSRANLSPAHRAELHETLQVCFAGNGGRLYAFLNAGQRERVKHFSLLCRQTNDLPAKLISVLSAQPKQEIAMGLLYSQQTHTAEALQQQRAAVQALPAEAETDHFMRFLRFFEQFAELFPAECRLLLSEAMVVENGKSTLTTDAYYLLKTAVNNQLARGSENLYAKYVNCFVDVKKAWRV